jgi:hypothetical protein
VPHSCARFIAHEWGLQDASHRRTGDTAQACRKKLIEENTVFIYSLSTLEQGAAAARFMKLPLTQLKKYGFGNDPHKNDMIRQEMQYKQNHCGYF